jgi:hypothetical protein
MPDGHSHSEYRHKSLESGVMRKYHAPFGGRPTEKGSSQSTSPAAHPTQSLRPERGWRRRVVETPFRSNPKSVVLALAHIMSSVIDSS